MTGGAVLERDLAPALEGGLREIGIDLEPAARRRLLDYVALLAKWNRTYNLTAIREPARMVTHHLLDSLAALPALEAHLGRAPDVRVLDVGSGAGLPGIPLAIARPGWRVTMLDPVHKKATFIAQATAELGLGNATALAQRAEEHRSESQYTLVISRAFADLAAFADAAARHVAPAGALVAMKGVHPHEELAELRPPFGVRAIVPLRVPGVDAARHLVFMSAGAT